MKHLIVCCDGTWNSPEDKSNVHRVHEALVEQEGMQEKHYVVGIGTSGKYLPDLISGAVGLGLRSRMVQAYDWLARNYHHEDEARQPDKISLFGFSRGAYIARNLAGLLTTYGLVPIPPGTDEDDQTLAEEVYSAYHQHEDGESVWQRLWSGKFAHPVEVYFLGAWDTVGSLGIPAEFGILDTLDASRYRFYNTRLSDRVIHARHAVALDERRGPFAPTLWDRREDVNGLTFRQVWFPGNHGTVGGTATDQGLSGLADITLQWMIDEAEKRGIAFDRPQLVPNPNGDFKENLRTFYRFVNPHPRAVPRITRAAVQSDADSDEVHESAPQRIEGHHPEYRPQTMLTGHDIPQATVTVRADQPWNDTGIWLTPGTYRFSARGTWSDWGTPTGPAGEQSGATLVRGGARVLELVQNGIRKVTRNDQARVFGTRRVITDDAGQPVPWMCLVGVIADGELDPKTELQHAHTTVKIGDGVDEFEVFRAGYFYAFANDAWVFYWNNAGTVELTVQQLSAALRHPTRAATVG